MDTVDAILLLLLLRRATPNSPRTTDRCAAAADQGRESRTCAIIIFLPHVFGSRDSGEGKVSFLSPEIGLACPASLPNCRTKADKMWFVARKVGWGRVFARYSMEGRKTALTF